MNRHVAGALVAALSTCCAVVALAQDGQQPTASDDVATIQQDGKAALKEGRLDDAIELFHAGLAKSSDEPTTWNMLLGLALAHQLKGDAVLAAANYQLFLSRTANHPAAQAGRWAARRKSATEDVAQLEPDVLTTHARVTLSTEPSGVTVMAPSTPNGLKAASPITLYLPPGQHELELSKPGHASMLLVVSVDKGQRVTVQRALVPLVVEPPSPVPEARPAPVPPDPKPAPIVLTQPAVSPVLAVLGWTMAGLGVAGIGAGIGFTIAAADVVDDLDALQQGSLDSASLARDASLRNQLRDLQAGAVGFFAGGGALAVGGALMLLFRPDGPLAVTPSVGAGFWGVNGRF